MVGKKFKIKRNNAFVIEPEEILPDAPLYNDPKNPKAYLENKLESAIPDFVFYILGIIFLIVSFGLIIYSSKLQAESGSAYILAAEKNASRVYPIAAPRGIIYDRNLIPLVENKPNFDLVVIPELLPENIYENKNILDFLEISLKMERGLLINFFSNLDYNSTEPIPLAFGLSHEEILKIESQIVDLPGFRLEKGSVRYYPFGYELAHVLGYTGRVNQQELKTGKYFPTDYVGKSGVELFYDEILRGSAGLRRFNVNARGHIQKEDLISLPASGPNLVLSIDVNLQKKIYDQFKTSLGGVSSVDGAAAVAIDPQSGEILALVSWPSFDNNLFASGISVSGFKSLVSDKNKPLFHRPISGVYPPGSSIKPFIALAALEENIIDPKKTIYAGGQIVIPNPYNPSNPSVFKDWKVHGIVDMVKAIANSVDVYFYTIGGGYGDVKGLGIDRIQKYLELFDFGYLTDIDLPAEASGLVPTPVWKAANKNNAGPWNIGNTYHVSIGQGDLLVTPLQLAKAFVALVADGKLFKPTILKSLVDDKLGTVEQIEPEVIGSVSFNQSNLKVVMEGMSGTTAYGTAASFSSLPFSSAGKTGTAQFGPGNSRTHSWMNAVAPTENSSLVLTVVVEGGGDGPTSAVPLAREILRWYFDEYQKQGQ
ncbi:penicillin-binding protein 2 [Candidatus Parcubacteria bacterium]|nr:MAG: penicillin-binding protein 2 [Candidatus Parcubacteria bacterium]